MGANPRTKGQSGEREVAKLLNAVVIEISRNKGLKEIEDRDLPFQRNQNQSAVGGSDLSNPFGLEIEVKRQEQLSINTWWKQTLDSANRTEGIPILIYRQNRKPWRVRMATGLPLLNVSNGCDVDSGLYVGPYVAEISLEDFLHWFSAYYVRYLAAQGL